ENARGDVRRCERENRSDEARRHSVLSPSVRLMAGLTDIAIHVLARIEALLLFRRQWSDRRRRTRFAGPLDSFQNFCGTRTEIARRRRQRRERRWFFAQTGRPSRDSGSRRDLRECIGTSWTTPRSWTCGTRRRRPRRGA